jgi:2-oxoglutarate dehydrogenase E1 component
MSDWEQLPSSANLPFVEGLYADYSRDPSSVSEEWRRYFEQLKNGEPAAPARQGPTFRAFSLFNPPTPARAEWPSRSDVEGKMAGMQERVDQIIRSYRILGHKIARINPLGFTRTYPSELDPEFHGFSVVDMERIFSCETLHFDEPQTLGKILDRLWNTYCRSIGVEYMHIDDLVARKWLQERMESSENRIQLTREEQIRILTRLTDAVTFEEFIRKKFVGAKSFSLEGSESLIPLLDQAINRAGEQGVKEIVLGMAHRGRLNVLANIMGKHPRLIFREFADQPGKNFRGGGDVKYHLGYSSDWKTVTGQTVHLSLCFNPSHLEFVNPVVLGRMRAKQDRVGDLEHTKGLAILIHGDAAFAGQGVTQETLNLSQLKGYSVGGTLHVVVNNQIGFTTSPEDGRSTNYATDVAKMLQVPIFHVNGEDPEAVAQVVKLSMDFRATFQRDVIIDVHGYRRLGHNEGDEPSFTQPVLYAAIQQRKSVREGYLEHLLKLKGLSREEADEILARRQEHLETELSRSKSEIEQRQPQQNGNGAGLWAQYTGGPEPRDKDFKTGLPVSESSALLEAQTKLPSHFHPHPKIKKILEGRKQMAKGEAPLDWAAAEALAFASLAVQGHRIRLTGQDVGRGTFSHRHAVLHDFENGHTYMPLQHSSPGQAPVQIYNSPLSEIGVLGFEYGYSLDYPDGLVLWEAQFGDFWNVAQVIVDQFIASAENKWGRLSGLVLLLPHGFEGQGPEHSSARLERLLMLGAEENIQVVNPTTPAQYFHLLRRQALRSWRKPLAVMTPKSLLRHPDVGSTLDEIANGTFQPIIPDPLAPEKVDRVLLCSGKVYYDLKKHREEQKLENVAIIRLEQLYPLHKDTLEKLLSVYAAETPVFWVQEEPENMGAWRFLLAQFGPRLFSRHPLASVARAASASPATGSASIHKREQAEVVQKSFA